MFLLKCFVIMLMYVSLISAQDGCDSFYPLNVGDTLTYGHFYNNGSATDTTKWIQNARKVVVNSKYFHEDTTFVIRTSSTFTDDHTEHVDVVETLMVVSDTVIIRNSTMRILLYPESKYISPVPEGGKGYPGEVKIDSCISELKSVHPYVSIAYARGYGEVWWLSSGNNYYSCYYLTGIVSACHPELAVKRMTITPVGRSSPFISRYFNLSGQKVSSHLSTGMTVRVSEKSKPLIINGLKQTHK